MTEDTKALDERDQLHQRVRELERELETSQQTIRRLEQNQAAFYRRLGEIIDRHKPENIR
mgnify:FL=1